MKKHGEGRMDKLIYASRSYVIVYKHKLSAWAFKDHHDPRCHHNELSNNFVIPVYLRLEPTIFQATIVAKNH